MLTCEENLSVVDTLRICTKCNIKKANEEFHLNGAYRRRVCRKCFNVYRREYCKLDKEERAKKRSEYVKARLAKFNGYQRKSYAKHREKRNAHSKQKYEKIREWFDNLKNKPCTDCHTIFPACCMDWDHLHNKTALVGRLLVSYNKNRILEEIKKCELVCANCHRIRTQNRRLAVKRGDKTCLDS